MIRVALNHRSRYSYDRPVGLGPQVVRLRPAPHCRTPIRSYTLRVTPADHFLNWQQDPHSNYLARIVIGEPTTCFEVEVELVAEMTVINPFDFFLEPDADSVPFSYAESLARDLKSFLQPAPAGPRLTELVNSIDRSPTKTIDFLVALNRRIQELIGYVIRLEPGVQTPEETLTRGKGSCRDSAWLLVQALRHLGLASRFVSGYLIQLKPDVAALDGPSGTAEDFTDLHAWAEVFLPGAGWIGMDPTSGLLAGEGHIPLACSSEPHSAAPISGTVGDCEVQFEHAMSVTRVHEDPRVTKPYTEAQWERIDELGNLVDGRLERGGVRLTMGGEPTFVSIDDADSEQWTTAAVGAEKRELAGKLLHRLKDRFAPGGLLHYGQGKWYPGEPLPRWALTCMWRTDELPIWNDPSLLADPEDDLGHTVEDATQFLSAVAEKLEVGSEHLVQAHEDALYYMWKERRLPANAELKSTDMDDDQERARLADLLARGLGSPTGCLLPLIYQWWSDQPRWASGTWPVRAEHLFLLPGDSPMGLRLPLESLPAVDADDISQKPVVPFEQGAPLTAYQPLSGQVAARRSGMPVTVGAGLAEQSAPSESALDTASLDTASLDTASLDTASLDTGSLDNGSPERPAAGEPNGRHSEPGHSDSGHEDCTASIVRTALCVEPREGKLHVFMPPTNRLEDYLTLLATVEETAGELELPVVIEGYLPPPDHRLKLIKVTPDPGVIEVNVHPANNWRELVSITSGLYEDARQSRLGTEKFDLDGTHTGTGGGNHVVLGAPTPAESPFLRRPDLLRSLIAYWHNHPSLSYLFSGRFIGPTSQAPRVDEGRRDARYELQIAFEQIPEKGEACPPSLVDRVLRHLLVDLTGNTHRAEFCIDKLYSPDSPTGRLGLVEFRAFEMPPHWQMSLTQQLLIRALVARFWEHPYETSLVDWNTSIHDRWMLPHFLQQDLEDVLDETQRAGIPLEAEWFAPHFEFRFPVIGELEQRGIQIELRTAIEPWYVLGEEPAGGHTARYVDSSVERLQVKVQGDGSDRYVITCNGRRIPLHPTGREGERVAGVRYRAWQPTSCLHPTIPVDEPLVFDVLDTWNGRSLGGCKYHVGHPGGLNPDTFPVNAYEAESRRAGRFFAFGHTGGGMTCPEDEKNESFPLTLDLRRHRKSNERSKLASKQRESP